MAKSLIISFQYNIESVYFFYSNPVLRTVNTQHTSRQDTIITVTLYLAKYSLIVIIAYVCCVLTVHNVLYELMHWLALNVMTYVIVGSVLTARSAVDFHLSGLIGMPSHPDM